MTPSASPTMMSPGLTTTRPHCTGTPWKPWKHLCGPAGQVARANRVKSSAASRGGTDRFPRRDQQESGPPSLENGLSNRSAVTGEKLFNVESGIITTWVKNVGDELTEPFPYRPELVGQPPPETVLGKGSGLDSVAIWLGKHGIHDADIKQIEAILAEVKGLSLTKKGLLNDDEFLNIVREMLPGRVS